MDNWPPLSAGPDGHGPHQAATQRGSSTGPGEHGLEPFTIAELRALNAAAPPAWILDGLWAAGDHMVLGADAKIGKSMAMVDLAVSVASGTAFLGALDMGDAGKGVAMFCAEDSAREVLRRLDAVCASRGLTLDDLPITVGTSVPQLGSAGSLAELARLLQHYRPAVVVLDPLCLAVGGASGASLYEMGSLLGSFGRVCRDARASAVVVHHWNKGGFGTGAARLSGTGTTQWARTIASVRAASSGMDGEGRLT